MTHELTAPGEPRLVFDTEGMSLARFLSLHFRVANELNGRTAEKTQVSLADGRWWTFIERKVVYCRVSRPDFGERTVYTAEINKIWSSDLDGKS